jgi:hypothetical protein
VCARVALDAPAGGRSSAALDGGAMKGFTMAEAPKWVERWETQRVKGRRQYTLTVGIPYGLAMFVAMTFFVGPPHALTLRLILINALVWALAGLAFGALAWSWCEWRYRKFDKSRAASDRTAV